MPVGFLCSAGSMNLRLGNVDTKFRVKNQYCTVSLRSSQVNLGFDNLLKNSARMTSLIIYHQPSTMKQMGLTMVNLTRFNTTYLTFKTC